MRFAFAGIDFLGDVFGTLIDAGWQPVKLFSRPCDGVYDFNEVTVARARALKIPVQLSRIQPGDLASLRTLRCDALIVAGYPWLIKGWEPHLTYAVNFHPSPLPEGRGPYPLFRALLDGASTWGMSAHEIDGTFDTGPIVAQRRFPLSPDESHDLLLARCQLAARDIARSLAADLPRLWAERRPQAGGSYWPRVTAQQRTVDWHQGVEDVLRTVRAFGSIACFARIESRLLSIWAASGWKEAHGHRPGTLVHKHRRHLLVAAADGFVQVTEWSASAPGEAQRDR